MKETLERIKTATASLIVGRAERIALLTRLMSESPAISVGRKRDDNLVSSSLLDIRAPDHTLWIDELSPALSVPLEAGDRLSVFGGIDGTPVSFRAVVRDYEMSQGLPTYALGLPRVLRLQRHRVHPRFVSPRPILVYLVGPNANVLEGSLRDISLGGLGVSVGLSALKTLRRGVRLPSCTVAVSSHDAVQAALEVRYIRAEPDSARAFIGGRFVQLNPLHQARLERFVDSLKPAA